MKQGIHPTYYPKAKVKCACGNTFETGSTLEVIQTEICSACHPFYTGTAKIIETGQVDKFKARLERVKALKEAAPKKPTKRGKLVDAAEETTKEAHEE